MYSKKFKKDKRDKMKKIISIMSAIMMLATSFTAIPVSAETTPHTLTKEGDYYLVYDAEDLQAVSDWVNSDADMAKAKYSLQGNIDFNNQQWTPIGHYTKNSEGKETPKFSGTFEGNGFEICNLAITSEAAGAKTDVNGQGKGLFGWCEGATINNLGVDNINISFHNFDYYYDGTNRIRTQGFGGMVGKSVNSKFNNCYVENSKICNLNGGCNDSGVGGFMGNSNWGTNVSGCYAFNITIMGSAEYSSGGFVGSVDHYSGISFEDCFALKVRVDDGRKNYMSTVYGFGKESSNEGDSYVRCYSDLADYVGNYSGNKQVHDVANSAGQSGMTQKALIDQVKADGKFAIGADGYPYIDYNKAVTAATGYAGGNGTAEDPYLIANASQLMKANLDINNGSGAYASFKLTADIDLKGEEWIPLGHNTPTDASGNNVTSYPFYGTFDGDNHVVKNMNITNVGMNTFHYNYAGFFGYLQHATVKNLGIENINVGLYNGNNPSTSTRINSLGGLAGTAQGDTKIENCYLKNSSILQKQRNLSGGVVGGFVGTVVPVIGKTPSIKNCYVYNTELGVSYMQPAGGFAGQLNGSNIENCYVAETSYTNQSQNTTIQGAVFGFAEKKSGTNDIKNCYSTMASIDDYGSITGATAYDYDSTKDVTPVVSNITEIQNSLGSVTGFKIDSTVNGGYPSFTHEAGEREYDFLISSVTPGIDSKDTSNGNAVTVNNNIVVKVERAAGNTDTPTIYLVTYNEEGRLIDAKSKVVDGDTTTFDTPCSYEDVATTTVKVFVWDENVSPVSDMYSGEKGIFNTLNEEYTPIGGTGSSTTPDAPAVTTDKTKIFLLGDSLTEGNTTPRNATGKEGWEDYIGKYISDVSIMKHGHGSQNIQMFMEGRITYHYCSWATIKPQVSEGDYVILALGTNDTTYIREGNRSFKDLVMSDGVVTEIATELDLAKGYWPRRYYGEDGEIDTVEEHNNGIENVDDKQFTGAQFEEWYGQIINDVIAAGGKVILLTPPTQSAYETSTGKFQADRFAADIVPHIKNVKETYKDNNNVILLDTRELFTNVLNNRIDGGETAESMIAKPKSGGGYTWGTIFVDSVHFTATGADLLAQTIAKAIDEAQIGLENKIDETKITVNYTTN